MRSNNLRSWKCIITLTTAILFGLSIFIAPTALADKKGGGRGHSKGWNKEKERESRKYDEERERESRKYDREQEREARKRYRERQREGRKHRKEMQREDRKTMKSKSVSSGNTTKRESASHVNIMKSGRENPVNTIGSKSMKPESMIEGVTRKVGRTAKKLNAEIVRDMKRMCEILANMRKSRKKNRQKYCKRALPIACSPTAHYIRFSFSC